MGIFSKTPASQDIKLSRKEQRQFNREPRGSKDFGKGRKDWKSSKDAAKKGKGK